MSQKHYLSIDNQIQQSILIKHLTSKNNQYRSFIEHLYKLVKDGSIEKSDVEELLKEFIEKQLTSKNKRLKWVV